MLLIISCTRKPSTEEQPSQTTVSSTASTTSGTKKPKEKWLIMESDTMVFQFHTSDFSHEEAEALFTDAAALSNDLCTWLELRAEDIITSDGTKPTCYFYSKLKREDGASRSWANWPQRKIYCVDPNDFAHEYIHLLIQCSDRLLYTPDNLLIEGLATYIGFTWQDTFGYDNYPSIEPEWISMMGFASSAEQATMKKMLADQGLSETPLNIYRVRVAYSYEQLGIDVLLQTKDTSKEFYDYHVGCVLVDYLAQQPGGIESVIALYCDAISAERLYGAPLDALLRNALTECHDQFYTQEVAD